MPKAGKLGRQQPKSPEEAPRLSLSKYLTSAVPTPPNDIDYVSRVAEWPMYANDQYGCCVWSMIGHDIEATTTYGQNSTVKVPVGALLKGYSDVTGFNTNDPSTDNGTVMQDAFGYWRKTGVGGHKILAFVQLDVKNMDEIRKALFLFGHVQVGINFPRSAMTQFDANQPWDVVANDGGLEGGHAIDLGRSFLTDHTVISWGKAQQMTQRFWDLYVEEAWAAIDQDWIDRNGHNPGGLDVSALNADFTSLTGKPGPFPVNNPTPTPKPLPPPPGSPDAALIKVLDPWSKVKRTGDNVGAEAAYNAWKKTKNYP